jgi:hypothetical protein
MNSLSPKSAQAVADGRGGPPTAAYEQKLRLTALATFPLLAYRHYAGHPAGQPVYTIRN